MAKPSALLRKLLWSRPLRSARHSPSKTVELTGPLTVGSTLSEVLLLEYLNGFQGRDLGWGRLTRENLLQVLEVHAIYADLMRRTAYLARARGSNLLAHVLLSMEQAASGKAVPGALGRPGDALLILAGHDTNLSNLSGMLGLSWHLQGYQPDDTPPGGALVFLLWRDDAGHDSVTAQYIAQSLDQMRNAERVTAGRPPVGCRRCGSLDVRLAALGTVSRSRFRRRLIRRLWRRFPADEAPYLNRCARVRCPASRRCGREHKCPFMGLGSVLESGDGSRLEANFWLK